MALAILHLDDDDHPGGHGLIVDTGTSTHYRLHLGTEVRREDDFALLDAPYWSSPLRVNPAAGRHVDTTTRAVVDHALVTRAGTLVQLESCRGADGHGPAFSAPIRLPALGRDPGDDGAPRALPRDLPRDLRRDLLRERPVTRAGVGTLSVASSSVRTVSLRAPRTVPMRSAAEVFVRPASIGDLIGTAVQAAAPVVLALLGGAPAAGAAGAPAATTADPSAALLATVLRTVLGALARTPAAASATTPAAPAPAAPGAAQTAVAQSTLVPEVNRFVPYARPMIFGVDDALLGALAGPLLQLLPQLLNSANQTRLTRQALTNQHVSDLLSEVDRSRLAQAVLSAQTMPGGVQLAPGDLAALAALLQPAPIAPAPAGTPASAVVPPSPAPASAGAARSQSVDGPPPIASRAALTMITAPPLTVLGRPRVAFTSAQAPTLRFRLDVGTQGPARALPKAILDVCVREPGAAHDLLRRSQRVTDLTPGAPVTVPLTAQEISSLPIATDLEVLACLRWRGARGTYQASCSQPVVMLAKVQVKERGEIVGDAFELTDMNRFRPFWNKVWASPPDSTLWGLDVAVRYSVVVTTTQRGNGLMQSRLQPIRPAEGSDDGLRATTRGRLKSGLESSITELAALLPLWPGEQPLADDDLAAVSAPGWLAGQGGDATTQVRMEGRKASTGQLWAVPVPRLRAVTLADVGEVDAYGQVLSTKDRVVHVPVIESVRLLGLTSRRETDATDEAQPGDGGGYRFDGYAVTLNQLVGLDPARPIPVRSMPRGR